MAYQVIRIVARADSALTHAFGFRHLQLAGITLYGSAQQPRFLAQAVEQRFFWRGIALNPLDKRTVASDDQLAQDGDTLKGIRSFSSGSAGFDWLTISAWREASQGAMIGVARTGADGAAVQPDWK